MALNSLASVPGLGGFVESQVLGDTQTTNNVQNAMRLQSIVGAQQEQQEMGRIRQIMQNGGSPDQVITALVGTGPKGAAMAQHYATALKSQQEAKLREKLTSGSLNLNDVDQLEALGASGVPGTAHLTSRAARLRSEATDRAGLRSMQDAPTAVPVASNEQAAIDLIRSGASTTATLPGNEGAEVGRGGIFETLMRSNNSDIAQSAKRVQDMVNAGTITAKMAESRLAQLEARQTALDAAQAGRQFGVDNRREAAPKVPVGYRLAADGQSIERIPVTGGAQVNQDTLRDDAYYSIINGKARPGSLPIGKDEGNRYREELRNKITEVRKELGLTESQLATMPAENKAKMMALNAVEKDLAAIRPFDEMLNTNVKIAIDLAKKISSDRTNSALLNKPITWLEQNAGDNPDIAEYLFQIQTVKTEGARILNNPRLVGQLTDSARQEMGNVINGNMPLGQTERVLQRMVSDGKNRVTAIEKEADTLRSAIRGSTDTKKEPSVEDAVKSAGYPYEPEKYDYRVGIGGQVQRKPK